MSKDEDLMRPEAKIQKGASKMRLVLAPGAADASDGTVYVGEKDIGVRSSFFTILSFFQPFYLFLFCF